MFYALSWFAVAWLVVLWSVAAWALHGVARWAASNAGALSDVGASAVTLPDWLVPWLPPEIAQWAGQLHMNLGPFIADVLHAVPVLTEGLATGITVVTWAIWVVGSALLLMLGAGLHLLIALWHRRRSGGSGTSDRQSPLATD